MVTGSQYLRLPDCLPLVASIADKTSGILILFAIGCNPMA